jgi:hypothetical protein
MPICHSNPRQMFDKIAAFYLLFIACILLVEMLMLETLTESHRRTSNVKCSTEKTNSSQEASKR